jgi:hypothetical protein
MLRWTHLSARSKWFVVGPLLTVCWIVSSGEVGHMRQPTAVLADSWPSPHEPISRLTGSSRSHSSALPWWVAGEVTGRPTSHDKRWTRQTIAPFAVLLLVLVVLATRVLTNRRGRE